MTYEYLWRPWVPFGHLSLVEGDEGVGKSMLLAALVADVTGGPRIDGGRRRRPGRWVLYLAGEESLSGGVVPRLRAAGADLSKVSFGPRQTVPGRCWRPELPTDLPQLASVTQQLRPGLVVLEPLVSFFSGAYDWRRDQDAHAVLDPLVVLAAESKAAFLNARHWTKAAAGPALARGMGSRAVSGCHAVVIALERQEGQEGAFRLSAAKYRLGQVPAPRSYTIVPSGHSARLEVGPAVEVEAGGVVDTSSLGEESKLYAARKLLRVKLADGWVPVPDLVKAAASEGLSPTALYTAKSLDKVLHRWNTKVEPKRSEWAAPKDGWPDLAERN